MLDELGLVVMDLFSMYLWHKRDLYVTQHGIILFLPGKLQQFGDYRYCIWLCGSDWIQPLCCWNSTYHQHLLCTSSVLSITSVRSYLPMSRSRHW